MIQPVPISPGFVNDDTSGFPLLGYYEIQAIFRGAQWIGISSRAEDKKIFDFVWIKLGLLNPATAIPVDDPFQTRLAKSAINFSRLFDEGKSLMKMGHLKNIDPSSDLYRPNSQNLTERGITFRITSPRDFFEANLTLQDLAERIIFQNLFPSQTGELTEAQRLRITQTKFLGPSTLSQMTNGDISVEEALLLIACLGLQKNNKKICVCDLATGNFHKDFQANMLTSDRSYSLIFLDPEAHLQSLPKTVYDQDKDVDDTKTLFEATKLIVQTVLGVLEDLFSLLPEPSQEKLAKDLIHASVDHIKVRQIIDQLETYFPDAQKQAVINCKTIIDQKTQYAFEKCRELVENLPMQEKFNGALKNIEARARLIKASQQKEYLEKKFKQFKPIILDYLKLMSQEYQIGNPILFNITWKIQETVIIEKMEITKTCAIARRVLCPSISKDNRSDLVYFSSDANEESVVSRWESLGQQYSFSDRQLVDCLLSLYQGNKIPDELMPFLSFLMILLLGKEPAYDSASYAANFILLYSIKLGVHTFSEALSRMPMIPQGAMAAKQFLLHVSGKPLDALARVQYKDKKQVPESTFLPTSTSFLGSANDWIQVYDDVATTALECCRRLFFQDLNPDDDRLVQLQTDLKLLFSINKLEVWDIPIVLKPFSEQRELIKNPKDKSTIVFLDQKNQCAARFLRSMGQTISAESNASEQCAQFLMRGVDLLNPRIQELQQIIDQHDSKNWQDRMLSELDQTKIKGLLFEAMEKTIRNWDPSVIFRNHNIDPSDYSDEGIIKMNKAWDAHFMQFMDSYQMFEPFANLREWGQDSYRIPILYHELAAAIDPKNSVNDEDPLAKWAISYILDRHPLKSP